MPTEQYFINEQSDFYNYLVETNAFKSRQTYRDYITRLKYVSQFYRIDTSLTKERVAYIIEDSSAKTIVTTKEIAEEKKQLIEKAKLKVILIEDALKSKKTANPNVNIPQSSLCYIISSFPDR